MTLATPSYSPDCWRNATTCRGRGDDGGISYFHAYAYDLLATNERIIAATCDAAIQAHLKQHLEKVTYSAPRWCSNSTNSWPSSRDRSTKYPPPRSSYGFQKLAVEYFARAAWDQHRLPYTIVRPFNCVGIGEARALGDVEVLSGNVTLAMSHVVPDLVQKVLRGQDPLHILGDGNQVRHYTYGGDLARGIVVAMEHPAALNEDFNLSTSASTTVLELAELIWKRIRGEQMPFRHVTDPPFQHDVQRGSLGEKARRVLASRPPPRSTRCSTRSSPGSSRRWRKVPSDHRDSREGQSR